MTTVTAKLLKTEGPWLEAVLEIAGQRFTVFDEFSVDASTAPQVNEEFLFTFSNELSDETWESKFNGNPEKQACIEHLSGWRYRCYGRVLQIAPVLVDCGLFVQQDVIHTRDTRVVGEYLAFTVNRMGGYAAPVSG